jgi:addiction module RelE/StbE family toxin
MLDLELSTQFKRDLKKIQKQHKNKDLLDDIVEQLQYEKPLHSKYRDHSLWGLKSNGTKTYAKEMPHSSIADLERSINPDCLVLRQCL